ncbi:ATP-binding protein [Streptosporangium sp. NBC_01639]|uniref:ATP-binding protein n=1 Tax=Streptosporangium sp. NBC_01639 TaxID=2975948 RepID=UPI003868438C|nr:ATP-binding protein [Streptosporangium sp. NBC_01639]
MKNPNPAPPSLISADENIEEACWELPADSEVVGKARRLTGDALAAWGMSAVAEDVTMVVSELVSNAIVHGKTPIVFSLHRHGRTVRGEVTDHSIVWPSPFPAGPDEEHGRGLAIVAAYADRWGVEPAPGGKTVWFVCAEWGLR